MCYIYYVMLRRRSWPTISINIEDATYISKDDKTVAIPNADDSSCSDDSDSYTDCNDKLLSVTYEKASKSYYVD